MLQYFVLGKPARLRRSICLLLEPRLQLLKCPTAVGNLVLCCLVHLSVARRDRTMSEMLSFIQYRAESTGFSRGAATHV